MLEEFPDLSKKPDIKFNDDNQIKPASRGEGRFGEKTRAFMHYMNSEPFLDFLSALTGIRPENEVSDVHLTLFRDRPQDAGRPKYQKPKGLKKNYLKLTGKY